MCGAFVSFFVLIGVVHLLRYYILNEFSSFSAAERKNIVYNGWIILVSGLVMVCVCFYLIRFACATWEFRPTGILVRHFFSSKEYTWDDLKQICVCKLKAARNREIPVICCSTESNIDFHPPKGSEKDRTWRSTDFVIYHPRKVLALPYSEELAEEIKRCYPQVRYLYEV